MMDLLQQMQPPQMQAQPDLAQQILTARFQPTAQDVGNAALAGVANNSYVAPEQYSNARMDSALKKLAMVAELQKANRDPLLEKGYQFNPQTGQYDYVFSGADAQKARAIAEAEFPYKLRTSAAGAGRTINNINAYAPFNEKLQEKMAGGLVDEFEKLQSIPSQVLALDTALQEIGNARPFMGTGGETLLNIANFANNRLGLNISQESVSSANTLRSAMFNGIMENLKKMDAQPSEIQQEAMQNALGGLGTDPNALPKIIQLQKEILYSKASEHNRRVTNAAQGGANFIYDVKVPLKEKARGEVPPAGQRIKGAVYSTPSGNMEWTGTGWLPAN